MRPEPYAPLYVRAAGAVYLWDRTICQYRRYTTANAVPTHLWESLKVWEKVRVMRDLCECERHAKQRHNHHSTIGG